MCFNPLGRTESHVVVRSHNVWFCASETHHRVLLEYCTYDRFNTAQRLAIHHSIRQNPIELKNLKTEQTLFHAPNWRCDVRSWVRVLCEFCWQRVSTVRRWLSYLGHVTISLCVGTGLVEIHKMFTSGKNLNMKFMSSKESYQADRPI